MLAKISSRVFACLCVCSITCPTLAQAASNDDSASPTLVPLVVTATRQPTPLDDLALPVTIIDRAQIERSLADDLAQLLRFSAGIDIGRNGGPGQATSTFIRGAESNHTLVLVDGVRINPGTLGLPSIQNIRPEMIERVEIVKGNRSSLYGSDAIGGVINVITRDQRSDRLEFGLGGGRYGAREATARVATKRGDTRFDFAAAYTSADGFPTKRDAQLDTGHNNLNVNAGVSTPVGSSTLSARWFQATGNTEYLDFFDSLVDQDFRNSVAAVTLDTPLTATWTSRVDVSLATDDIEQQQSDDVANTDRLAIDWQNTIDLGADQTLVAGLYAFTEDTESLVFGTGFDEQTDVVAVYVEDNLQRDAHTLSVAARYTDHDTFGGQTTWHVDYGYALNETLALYGSASRGFRAPDATDRFGFGGDPNLNPEVSTSVEAGLSWRPSGQQRIRFTAFDNAIDDLIIFDFDPVTFAGQNRNIAEARTRGIEASYEWRSSDWGVLASAVIQDPENEQTGGVLPRRARRSLTINAFRKVRRAELGFDLLLSGERKDSDFSAEVNAGYVLANLSARVPVNDKFEFRAKIENLLDAEYETAFGFNTPGRGLYLDVYYRNR
ncbi:MAG: TonB-dependent receptor plug domain-containing protein [Gammaproteobacteria bacterium]